ncbi:hypothetical protein TWF694_004518 [Orbilia ellipsospora]|uniref:C2H2-type domain-containing protein n=1 Tax=Orbilia ellipsospora TaxID=2528407 RepID=A0AAV9WWC3_9PEZI
MSHVLIQWEIPSGTLFSKSARLSRYTGKQILCPEKNCGLVFQKQSMFKRHVAGLIRPFHCLRGICYVEGSPSRSGFGRIEEVVRHLKNGGIHHEAVVGRPVEGWDFRRKTPEETNAVIDVSNLVYLNRENSQEPTLLH